MAHFWNDGRIGQLFKRQATFVSVASATPRPATTTLTTTSTSTSTTTTARPSTTSSSTSTVSSATSNIATSTASGSSRSTTSSSASSASITASVTSTSITSSSSSSRSSGALPLSTDIRSVPVAPLQVVLTGAQATAQAANPVLAIPSASYTGQALLTASCAVPQYTFLPQADGAYVVAPIVGCNGQNPGCCPSLALDSVAASITTTSVQSTAINSAMVSAIEAAPLTVCPGDYSSIGDSCCPVGFSMYTQQVLNQTPCFSRLASTFPVPALVTAQISAVSSILAQAQSKTATIRTDPSEVFALSFPLRKTNSGLSLGAKIGIAVGSVALAIGLALLVLFVIRKRQRKTPRGHFIQSDDDIAAWTTKDNKDANSMTQFRQSKASSTSAPSVVSAVPSGQWSPEQGHTSYADREHIPGPENQAWDPSQQQAYFRAPPPRGPLQNMSMGGATAAGLPGNPSGRYSELAGSEYVAPVEVDGQQQQQQQQPYMARDTQLYDAPMSQSQSQYYNAPAPAQGAYEMDSTSYQPPPHPAEIRHEMGGAPTPTPQPRWMQ